MKLFTIAYRSNGFAKIERVRAANRATALRYFAEAYPHYSDAQIISEKQSAIV